MQHHYILYTICTALIVWNVILHSKITTVSLFQSLVAKLKAAGVDLYDVIAKSEKSAAPVIPAAPVVKASS